MQTARFEHEQHNNSKVRSLGFNPIHGSPLTTNHISTTPTINQSVSQALVSIVHYLQSVPNPREALRLNVIPFCLALGIPINNDEENVTQILELLLQQVLGPQFFDTQSLVTPVVDHHNMLSVQRNHQMGYLPDTNNYATQTPYSSNLLINDGSCRNNNNNTTPYRENLSLSSSDNNNNTNTAMGLHMGILPRHTNDTENRQHQQQEVVGYENTTNVSLNTSSRENQLMNENKSLLVNSMINNNQKNILLSQDIRVQKSIIVRGSLNPTNTTATKDDTWCSNNNNQPTLGIANGTQTGTAKGGGGIGGGEGGGGGGEGTSTNTVNVNSLSNNNLQLNNTSNTSSSCSSTTSSSSSSSPHLEQNNINITNHHLLTATNCYIEKIRQNEQSKKKLDDDQEDYIDDENLNVNIQQTETDRKTINNQIREEKKIRTKFILWFEQLLQDLPTEEKSLGHCSSLSLKVANSLEKEESLDHATSQEFETSSTDGTTCIAQENNTNTQIIGNLKEAVMKFLNNCPPSIFLYFTVSMLQSCPLFGTGFQIGMRLPSFCSRKHKLKELSSNQRRLLRKEQTEATLAKSDLRAVVMSSLFGAMSVLGDSISVSSTEDNVMYSDDEDDEDDEWSNRTINRKQTINKSNNINRLTDLKKKKIPTKNFLNDIRTEAGITDSLNDMLPHIPPHLYRVTPVRRSKTDYSVDTSDEPATLKINNKKNNSFTPQNIRPISEKDDVLLQIPNHIITKAGVILPPADSLLYLSNVVGVVWDKIHNSWVVNYTLLGRRYFQHFPAKKFGFLEGRQLAIELRLAKDREKSLVEGSVRGGGRRAQGPSWDGITPRKRRRRLTRHYANNTSCDETAPREEDMDNNNTNMQQSEQEICLEDHDCCVLDQNSHHNSKNHLDHQQSFNAGISTTESSVEATPKYVTSNVQSPISAKPSSMCSRSSSGSDIGVNSISNFRTRLDLTKRRSSELDHPSPQSLGSNIINK